MVFERVNLAGLSTAMDTPFTSGKTVVVVVTVAFMLGSNTDVAVTFTTYVPGTVLVTSSTSISTQHISDGTKLRSVVAFCGFWTVKSNASEIFPGFNDSKYSAFVPATIDLVALAGTQPTPSAVVIKDIIAKTARANSMGVLNFIY